MIISDQYNIYFQYEVEGLTKYDGHYMMTMNGKGLHKQVEKRFIKKFKDKYKNLKVTRITCD